jgi:two-component system, OmpR family, sensor histidine kinase KdpD
MMTRTHPLRAYVLAVILTAGATFGLWVLRDVLTPANFSLIYLLVVLIVAVSQGTKPSLFTALLSFLCFNFFLVKPIYTFHVTEARDLLDLLIYFACATLTGQLASDARQQTENARLRAYEQNVLYELTSVLNQQMDSQNVYTTLQQVLCKLPSINQVDTIPHQDHTPVPDQTTLYLLLRAGEKVYGVLSVTFDSPPSPSLIELVRACVIQAAIALQRIELVEHAQRSKNFEEADRLKTALLRAVSHDLRTPLTIIKTSANNLLTFYATLPENERVDMLKTVENEADHLNKMVGNLLDLSRLEAGALQINRELNSLEEVAGDVAARIWQLTHQERIKITFPDDMPLVSFDYGLILQVLSNLVDNALRYERESHQVEICGSVVEQAARVAVSNHGPNILPEERTMIMQPFYHGQGGNIGLGVAIAKGIVEAHGGKIWIEDTPGGGATFVFSLPLEGDADDENSGRG